MASHQFCQRQYRCHAYQNLRSVHAMFLLRGDSPKKRGRGWRPETYKREEKRGRKLLKWATKVGISSHHRYSLLLLLLLLFCFEEHVLEQKHSRPSKCITPLGSEHNSTKREVSSEEQPGYKKLEYSVLYVLALQGMNFRWANERIIAAL